jgi:pyruvate/2-oxoglutarate dehydrogenase complex dihydrolipoamide dehydrogenase (E3) component
MGAGPIGCEMAQAFSRLGTAVTVIDQASRVLPTEDADAAAIVARRLTADGVALRLGVTVTDVSTGGDGILVRVGGPGIEDGGSAGTLACDQLLLAVGRTPNVEDLNLAAAGVAFDQNGVVVDDHLRTTNRRVFAAGDVCTTFKFTHAADAFARIVIQNALLFGRKRASALVIPWCTYTDPEVAHVGAYEDEARRAGRRVETITIALADVDRAVVDEERDGFVRVHHEHGRLLGCTMVASRAGEMIGMAAHALTHGASLSALGSTIVPYPTLSNAFRAASDAQARTRLTPIVRRVLRRYFRLF